MTDPYYESHPRAWWFAFCYVWRHMALYRDNFEN